jgi:hypothetical protein
MAERVLQLAVAVAPEHVGDRHQDRRAGLDGLFEAGVDVLHVVVNRDRRALQRIRAECLMVGPLVGQHQHGVADLQAGVHHLAARSR